MQEQNTKKQILKSFGPLSFTRLLILFFLVILGGFIIRSILFLRNSEVYKNTNERVTHARDVIAQATLISTLAKDMQWESRNYLLTGDSDAYHAYSDLLDTLKLNETRLSSLCSGKPSQEIRIRNLKTLVDSLEKFIETSFQKSGQKPFSLPDFISNKQRQNIFHALINKQIGEIIGEEKRLLALSERVNNQNILDTYTYYYSLEVLILLLLFSALLLVLYQFNKRRKAERILFESEKKFRLLLNSIKGLAIFVTDEKGIILDWYEGAYQLKGYRKSEVTGKHFSIFYLPDDIARGVPERNLEDAGKNGSLETEGWRVRKDGSRFWADILIAAIYDKEGTLRGFAKLTRDYSLHKKAEEDSRHALEKERELNAMKSNFVTIASHEFRTPLSTILSSVFLIERYRTDEDQLKRENHIRRIRAAVSDLVYILEEFLSLEKIEEGKTEVKKERFNLEELARTVCFKLSPTLKQGQHTECLHSGNGEVDLDKNFTEHILSNLVSNAVKYSPAGTRIVIRTNVTEHLAELIVEDQGIGISPEDQKHLFERFYRASNTGNEKGTGLGLHIVKRYVEMMEGEISVHSEPDKGSRFTVRFQQ
jgi:PAS domain S-box-containing protein